MLKLEHSIASILAIALGNFLELDQPLCEFLTSWPCYHAGMQCGAYYAGLKPSVREEVLADWSYSDAKPHAGVMLQMQVCSALRIMRV